MAFAIEEAIPVLLSATQVTPATLFQSLPQVSPGIWKRQVLILISQVNYLGLDMGVASNSQGNVWAKEWIM